MRKVVLYALCAVGCTMIFLYPLSIKPGQISVDGGDSLQQVWTMHWVQQALASPEPLFHAPSHYPYAKSLVLYQPLYTSAWLTYPFYAAGLQPLTVYNIAIMLSFMLAFLGVALLVHHLTQQPVAAFAAGFSYAFATARIAHLPHLNLLSGYWIPFVLLCLVRLARADLQRRQYVLYGSGLAGLLAAQFLADIYHAVFMGVILGCVLIYALLVKAYNRYAWLTIGGALAVAVLLCLPILLPSLQAQQELGLTRSFDDHQKYAGSLEIYTIRDQPSLLWAPQVAHDEIAPFGVEDLRWPGLITLILAAVSLGVGWKHYRWYALFGLIFLGALIWSLGPSLRWSRADTGLPNPLYSWFYEYVPLMSAVRVPTRWGLVVQLGLSILAGYGLAGLLLLLRRRWQFWGLALVVGGALLLDGWHGPITGQQSVALEPTPGVYAHLASLPAAALLEFPLENSDETLSHRYVYYGLFHPHHLLNGAHSITSTKYNQLRTTLRDFPSADSVVLLHDLGVRYVNVNRWELSNWPAWQAKLDAAAGLKLVGSFDEQRHLLYEIRDVPAAPAYATVLDAAKPQLVIYAPQPLWTTAPATYYEAAATVPLTLTGRSIVSTQLELPSVLFSGLHSYSLAATDELSELSQIELGAYDFKLLTLPTQLVRTDVLTMTQIVVDILDQQAATGDVIDCIAYGRGPVAAEQLVWSLSLVDGAWNPVHKRDIFFDDTITPPQLWQPDHWSAVPCQLVLPPLLEPGEYFLVVGLFDPHTQTYHEFADASGTPTQVWRVPTPIRVEP